MKVFAERLRELRVAKGLSVKALGRLIGVSDMAIIRWESDKTDIIGENLVKLSRFFGVTTDFLLGEEGY